MRSVRCDACGGKALVAASQCPHCGHLFEIRDSFGELLPLAHCPACDSDYPLERGECRWCGTKPEGFRIAPYAWKGAGIVVFLGMGFGAWLAQRSTADDLLASQSPAAELVGSPEPRVDSGPASRTLALSDSANTVSNETPTVVVAGGALPADSVSAGPMQSLPVVDTTPAPAPLVVETTPVRAPPAVAPRARPTTKASAPPRRRVRWVGAVARTWIPVRASASPKSRVVASIGPDTRVQLGDSRDAWIRVRTRGLSGWVERRHFFARPGVARR